MPIAHKRRLSDADAHRIAMKAWGRIQSSLHMKPLDWRVSAWIKTLQGRGIVVIALTARRPGTSFVTIRQLRDLDIRFSAGNYVKSIPESLFFKEGVIFAGEFRPKGMVLKEFLQHFSYAVTQIIFVDNYASNLTSVEESFVDWPAKLRLYRFKDPKCVRLLSEK